MEGLFYIIKNLVESGSVISYIFVFFGGVLVSFTPCLYPLIPVTAGFIGASSHSKLKGFILSLFYVLGIAITYSILGIIAALTGSIFGNIAESPIIYLIVGNVCIILALSMLGLFELPIVDFGIKAASIKKKGIIPAIIVGLISGLVVAPCTTPALGVVLAYVASRQNVVFGASLLFCFAYGVGFLLIIVGTFSGVIAVMPKSGVWMMRIKKICGVILLLAGEYFLISAGGF